MSEELKHCPFCGSSIVGLYVDNYRLHLGTCGVCSADGPAESTEAEAIAAWNRRAQPEPAAPVKTEADAFCDLHCADEHVRGCVRAEPVAWMNPASQSMVGKDDGTGTAFHIITTSKATGSHTIPLYTRPPRTALTVESIREEIDAAGLDWHNGWTVDDDSVNRYLLLCRAIEAAHGITASEGAA